MVTSAGIKSATLLKVKEKNLKESKGNAAFLRTWRRYVSWSSQEGTRNIH